MGCVPVSFNSSCVCMCGCVCVCVRLCAQEPACVCFVACRVQFHVLLRLTWTRITPRCEEKFHPPRSLLFLFCVVFFFLTEINFCAPYSHKSFAAPRPFVLASTGHEAATQKKKEQSITHTRTHVLARLGKRSRDCSTHFRKAQGQKGEEAPCQVLQLHRCELGFGRAVGRG